MTTLLAPPQRSTRPTRRERRAERRRLKHLDALSSQLADLHAIGELLGQAADVVSSGWVQGAWFTVDTSGGPRSLTAYDVGLADELPVVGACLVGAVVHAAGGPTTVRSSSCSEASSSPGRCCTTPECRCAGAPGPTCG